MALLMQRSSCGQTTPRTFLFSTSSLARWPLGLLILARGQTIPAPGRTRAPPVTCPAMAAPASYESVACPNCGERVAFGVLNEHLDQCLARERSSSPKKEAPTGKRKADAPPDAPTRRDARDTRPRKDPMASSRPFAERMRPRSLREYVGQEAVVRGALLALLQRGQVPSMVLWGPPGTGKTTLARLVTKEASADAHGVPYRFIEMSATVATVTEMKKVMDEAVHRQQLTGQRSVLFIDEIQRLNRSQQDIFLPALEKGYVHAPHTATLHCSRPPPRTPRFVCRAHCSLDSGMCWADTVSWSCPSCRSRIRSRC